MTTDNKTLADVQPGGRVRLGDQAELDRLEFQAWARELLPCPFCGNSAEFVPYKDNGLTLKCTSMGCVQRNQRTLRYGIDWLRTSMTEHWNARALSAQPSPGGQGDAWDIAELVRTDLDRQSCPDAYMRIAMESVVKHLAARQPVSETDAYQQGFRDGQDRTCTVAARQPVGEPVAWRYRAQGDKTKWYYSDTESLLGLYQPLYAAPPAQAVDLGQFREAIAEWRSNWANYGRTMTSAGRDTSKARRNVDEADRLLALIDSQAVGK